MERSQTPSRKERRKKARQQARGRDRSGGSSAITRRNLLIGAGGLAALVAIGALASNSQTQTEPYKNPDQFNPELFRLDQEIRGEPSNALEAAKKVGELAVTYFCQEMNSQLGVTTYNPDHFKGKVFIEPEELYFKNLAEQSGCILDAASYKEQGNLGHILAEFNELHVNLYQLLTDTRSIPHKPVPYPAPYIFAAILHELHHLQAPFKDTAHEQFQDEKTQKIKTVKKKRGLMLLAEEPDFNKPGKTCWKPIREPIEEAVVQHSTDKMLKKLGITIRTREDYELWVQRYQALVIDRLFNKDHTQLLRHQQASDDTGFFALVGNRLGFSGEEAAQMGDKYLFNSLVNGTPTL